MSRSDTVLAQSPVALTFLLARLKSSHLSLSLLVSECTVLHSGEAPEGPSESDVEFAQQVLRGVRSVRIKDCVQMCYIGR